MKKNFKVFGIALVTCLAMIACESDNQEFIPESADLKSANSGMIKSYDNDFVVRWNEALSLAINNGLPPASEARIYVIVSLAVHDALNNVVPKYETYALDNRWVNYKEISKKNIESIANAAVAQAAHDAMVALVPATVPGACSLLETCLSEIEESDFKARGIQIGKDAAMAVLGDRQSDPLLGFQSWPQGTQPVILPGITSRQRGQHRQARIIQFRCVNDVIYFQRFVTLFVPREQPL